MDPNVAITADTSGNNSGLATGKMGHLRDSDPTQGESAEDMTCQVTAGSPNVTCTTPMTFRTLYDVVQPGNHAIVGLDSNRPNAMVLEAPWNQASGTVQLHVHREHRNYLVAFSLPCPALGG